MWIIKIGQEPYAISNFWKKDAKKMLKSFVWYFFQIGYLESIYLDTKRYSLKISKNNVLHSKLFYHMPLKLPSNMWVRGAGQRKRKSLPSIFQIDCYIHLATSAKTCLVSQPILPFTAPPRMPCPPIRLATYWF